MQSIVFLPWASKDLVAELQENILLIVSYSV